MTATQPPWIEKRPFSKAPLRALTSAPIVGRAVAETLQKLPVPPPFAHDIPHRTAFVFSNLAPAGWWGEGVARVGRGVGSAASWPRAASPDPGLASAHTAQRPAGAELRPGVLGEEEGRRSPASSFLSPSTHGKDLSFLSVRPCTLILYCSVKETVVSEALSKSARLVQ